MKKFHFLSLVLTLFFLTVPTSAMAITNGETDLITSSVTSITLTAGENGKVSWSIQGEAKKGVKVVWSKEPNPTYFPRVSNVATPAQSKEEVKSFEDPKINSTQLDAMDYIYHSSRESRYEGTYYVRVCEYLGGYTCGTYSNEIQIDLLHKEENKPERPFYDVYSGDKYYEAIQYLKEKGVVQGYEDEYFGPKLPINRAEFLKMVMETTGHKLGGTNCYSDVKDEWFAQYVCSATEMGFVQGYEGGYFKPAEDINVPEAAKIMVKVLGLKVDETNDENWYHKYVKALELRSALPTELNHFEQKITREVMAGIIYVIDSGDTSHLSTTYENLKNQVSVTRSVHFYKEGTNLPIANQWVQIEYERYCVSSPCYSSKVVHQGYTNDKGIMNMQIDHAQNLCDSDEYFIKVENFITLDSNCPPVLSEEDKGHNTISMAEAKESNQPIALGWGEEFFIKGQPFYGNNFKLNNVDLENGTVKLIRMIGHHSQVWLENDEIHTKTDRLFSHLELKKGESSYIPGDVTDSTFTLESLSPEKVILSYKAINTTKAWAAREPLDFSGHLLDDREKEYTYQELLNYIESWNGRTIFKFNLKPYFSDDYRFLYAASPFLNDEKNEGQCFFIKVSKDIPPSGGWIFTTTVQPCESKKMNSQSYFYNGTGGGLGGLEKYFEGVYDSVLK